jgi:hypothetical protein
VLDRLEDPPATTHRLLEQVNELIGPEPAEPVDTAEAEAIADAMGWDLKITSPAPLNRLALALAAIGAADFPLDRDAVLTYARAVEALADEEVASVPGGVGGAADNEAMVRYIVLGTILIEPLMLALRRLALINASARRYGRD